MSTFLFFTIFAAILAVVGFFIRYKGKLKSFADFDLRNPNNKSGLERIVDLPALSDYLGRLLFLLAGLLFVVGVFFALGWDTLAWLVAVPIIALPFVAIYQLSNTDRFIKKD